MDAINYENLSPKTIYIDSKEKLGNNRSKRFIEFINKHSKKKYEIVSNKNLEVGDYIFEDVVVEFKELEDFRTCMHSGKLTSQIFDLYISDFIAAYLVIKGDISDLTHQEYKTLTRFGNQVSIVFVDSYKECWELILYWFGLNGRHLTQQPIKPMKNKKNLAYNMLLATCELSEFRINKIVREYQLHTFQDVFKLTKQHLIDCGVSEKKSERIIKILNGESLL